MAAETGTSNKDFDIISVLYHALQGASTASKYASDAREAGDTKMASFFQNAHDQYAGLAKEAKSLLKAEL